MPSMPTTTSGTLCLAGILLSCICLPLSGLQIHEYEKARHLRFEEGSYPVNPEPNRFHWANDYVFNGVGWSTDDPVKSFVLISPRHFVGANHFRPALGSQIQFLSFDGQVRTYTYAKFYNIENSKGEDTDLFIGELAENIPASHNIPLYPVLQTPEGNLVGRQIVVYGRGQSGPRIGRGTIGTFSDSLGVSVAGSALNDTRNYSFEYVENTAREDDSYGESGDSGSPSFVPVDGMLTVSGIHSAILRLTTAATGTVNTTYDSFILHYRDQINDHLAATGHQLTFAPIENAGLHITGIDLRDASVVISLSNPSGLPFDVHESNDSGSPDWKIVATSQTGSTWTSELPPDRKRLLWKLVRFPLPSTPEDRDR